MTEETKFDDQQSEVMIVLSPTSKLVQGPTQPPVQMVTRSKCTHDHSPPSSVEVKNERSCNYDLQICCYGAYRQNFTFYDLKKQY